MTMSLINLTFSNFLGISNLSDGVCILLAIVAVVVLAGISCFLFYRIKTDGKRLAENKIKKILINPKEFECLVNRYAMKPEQKLKNSLYRVDILNYDKLKTDVDEESFKTLFNEIVSRLHRIQPSKVDISQIEDDKFLVMVRADETQTQDIISKIILKNLRRTYALNEDLSVQTLINVTSVSFPKYGNNYHILNEHLATTMESAKKQGNGKFIIYTEAKKEKETAQQSSTQNQPETKQEKSSQQEKPTQDSTTPPPEKTSSAKLKKSQQKQETEEKQQTEKIVTKGKKVKNN